MKPFEKPLLAALVLLLFAAASVAQDKTGALGLGQKPPAIELQSLLNAPAETRANWDALQGKVVVLEFWATWCGPCVESIAHLNELADAFQDKPVQFIAVTDESEETIKEFIVKKPIHAWLGLDTNKSMHRSYGVSAIPYTVIIGADGKIAAITNPTALEAKHLENVLAGKDSGLPPPKPMLRVLPGEIPDDGNPKPPPVFQIVIRPATTESQGSFGGSAGKNEFGMIYGQTIQSSTVAKLLPHAYGVAAPRIVVDAPLPEGKFDVFIRLPAKTTNEFLDALFRDAIEATFNLTSKREEREVEVYVLTAKSDDAQGLQPNANPKGRSLSWGSSKKGHITAVGGKIETLAGIFEKLLGKPVVDETGLKGSYDVNAKWEQQDPHGPQPAELIGPIREQLGLELTLAKRPVEVVVVGQRAKPEEASAAATGK
jgi:uncharacterized protein (TIGR03435 family)